MSGIAGIIHFDGRPVGPGQVEAMTAAMHYRGPDGINHWRRGNVALGQCMLRTTPESLEENQPLTNEDESLVLVMDGRVDNFEELRRELLGRGAMLRTRADTELVLRAYDLWGEDCPDRIIGEYVFFIWDARRQRFFAARDAAGTRHFYYHAGNGWFAFASEIKGLLTLPIDRRLNESRLLDYLVPEFDRDDEVGTFYQGILRMPAGHAMSVNAAGPRIWRWWKPGELSEQKFASMEECTDAFMDQLRVAVKCRLRSIKPVGAMLSGGLDSSSIVGLIGKEFRDEVREPLRTFSLIRADRENCPDWNSIRAVLTADPWLHSTIITATKADEVWRDHVKSIAAADDPFACTNGFTYGLIYASARTNGCGVVLDGMAGDVMFYSFADTARFLAQSRKYRQLPALLGAYGRHGFSGALSEVLQTLLADLANRVAPDILRSTVRRRRDERRLDEGDMKLVKTEVARHYLRGKRSLPFRTGQRVKPANDQVAHASHFTKGTISFGHELLCSQSLSHGIEPRSPFSDRRLIEFSIQMPVEAKISIPWYKHVLRAGTAGMLPDSVRWRKDIGGHPGWTFGNRLANAIASGDPGFFDAKDCAEVLGPWVDLQTRDAMQTRFEETRAFDDTQSMFQLAVLTRWLSRNGLVVE